MFASALAECCSAHRFQPSFIPTPPPPLPLHRSYTSPSPTLTPGIPLVVLSSLASSKLHTCCFYACINKPCICFKARSNTSCSPLCQLYLKLLKFRACPKIILSYSYVFFLNEKKNTYWFLVLLKIVSVNADTVHLSGEKDSVSIFPLTLLSFIMKFNCYFSFSQNRSYQCLATHFLASNSVVSLQLIFVHVKKIK